MTLPHPLPRPQIFRIRREDAALATNASKIAIDEDRLVATTAEMAAASVAEAAAAVEAEVEDQDRAAMTTILRCRPTTGIERFLHLGTSYP